MRIGVIGAMEEETKYLIEELHDPETWEEVGTVFYKGIIGNHEVVIVRSGIGKVMASMVATLLISHYHVDALINTGSAGGIGHGLQVGDLVIATELAYFDADVTAFGYSPGQMAGMPLYYSTSEALVEATEKGAMSLGARYHTGLIVSGDSFVSSKAKIDSIRTMFPNVLANEMEGAAIAQVAFVYNVPFIVIRAISDNGDEEANVVFDEFIVEAGRRSAELVLEEIRLIKEV